MPKLHPLNYKVLLLIYVKIICCLASIKKTFSFKLSTKCAVFIPKTVATVECINEVRLAIKH